MAEVKRKKRKILMWIILATLMAALVWAFGESGQSARSVSDAGKSGMDMEMATLETASVKPEKSKAPNINWNEWNRLEKAVKNADAAYKPLAAKAKAESSAEGQVTEATRSAGMAKAREFKQASDNFAAFLDKNNCKSRAKTVRSVGDSRLANAEMVFNPLDSDKISAYNDQQSMMAKDRKETIGVVKTDASAAEVAQLKAGLLPRLKKTSDDLTKLLGDVTHLLDNVRSQVGASMSPGAIAGCMGGSAAGSNPMSALLSPLTNLLSLVKSLGSNAMDMISEVTSL